MSLAASIGLMLTHASGQDNELRIAHQDENAVLQCLSGSGVLVTDDGEYSHCDVRVIKTGGLVK